MIGGGLEVRFFGIVCDPVDKLHLIDDSISFKSGSDQKKETCNYYHHARSSPYC